MFRGLKLMKTKGLNEAHFLSLLEKALSRASPDPQLAITIYAEVEREIRLIKDLESFEKFCEKGSLPNLAPETVAELQSELSAKFGEGKVTLIPDENEKTVAVEIGLPDRTVTSRVKVQAGEKDTSEGHPQPRFVPFPISLPEDQELGWVCWLAGKTWHRKKQRELSPLSRRKSGQQRMDKSSCAAGAKATFPRFLSKWLA